MLGHVALAPQSWRPANRMPPCRRGERGVRASSAARRFRTQPAPLPFDSAARVVGRRSFRNDRTASSLAQWWLRFDDPLLASLVSAGDAGQHQRARAPRPRCARRARCAMCRRPRCGRRVGGSASAQRSTRGRQEPRQQLPGRPRCELGARHLRRQSGRPRRERSGGRRRRGASLGDVQVSIAAEVALAYITLRGAQARLAIAQDNLETQLETLQITRVAPAGRSRHLARRRAGAGRRPNRRARCCPRCRRASSRRGTRSRC